MARRIAIANQKGGSGKTTVTVNLAATLAERGRRVLVLDLDPQAHSTLYFGLKESAAELAGILDALKQDPVPLTGLAVNTGVSGVDIVPSSAWLHHADKHLTWKRVGNERLLNAALERLPEGAYDYVLFDCAPDLKILTLNALGAAREVLIPVEASSFAIDGLADLTATIEDVREDLNPQLRITGVVVCRADRTRITRDIKAYLQENFGPVLLETVIRESVRAREAPSNCEPLTVYASDAGVTDDFRRLAAEVIAQETRDSTAAPATPVSRGGRAARTTAGGEDDGGTTRTR